MDYAFIKNGNVTNVAVFDNPTQGDLNMFKEIFGLDDIIEANQYTSIGGTWDGLYFWQPQPYLSWIKDEVNKVWMAPIAKPDSGLWSWDEPTLSWVELVDEERNA
jgi:hypothetical protein